ncbi:hypothetical protein P4479_21905 [Brevibacillus agri]|uniref:hypothetical protein n=1 Tax=Brevibacillus agri TaxID=51101 RepID=UPI000314BEF6|nr:hypothetical protein [Brevibacillus agri]MED3501086.1 hypothetical protein [Brevibacillus agri]
MNTINFLKIYPAKKPGTLACKHVWRIVGAFLAHFWRISGALLAIPQLICTCKSGFPSPS